MNADLLVIALNTALLVGLWWLWFVGYRDYLVDRTRQDLFRIRDDLFDRAAAGEIGFDVEAYKVTRATLNGMIHYAHELSVLRVLLTAFIAPGAKTNVKYACIFIAHMERVKAELTPAQKVFIEGAFNDMHRVTLRHLRDGSLVVRALALTVKLVGVCVRHTVIRGLPLAVRLAGRIRKGLSTLSDRMDADANLMATSASSSPSKLTTFSA
ncbi:MAG: hypothetical protein ACYCXX_02005 [Acidiferrobacter thiooxydans]|jgi:hypothetical protein